MISLSVPSLTHARIRHSLEKLRAILFTGGLMLFLLAAVTGFLSVQDYLDILPAESVIISRAQNKYVFCKHRSRDTWEVPGGHREAGENILDTAKREL